jgi:hypothetical protein
VGVKRRPCLCERERGAWFYGDSPSSEPDVRRVPGTDVFRCRHGVRWEVARIHGGGLYGDLEWRRVPASER